MGAATVLLQLLNGLQFGVLLFLLASGLTLTFGIMRVINLAHGSFFMMGAYLAYHFSMHAGLALPLALILAIASVAVTGAILEWFTLAPLVNRSHLDQVLLTYGLILIFDELATILWGKDVQPAEIPQVFQGSVNVFSLFDYPLYRLVIIAAGLLTALALYLLIAKTRLGMIVRAGTTSREMVRALGIPVRPVFSIVFGIGAALAAFGGIIASPVLSISPGMGDRIIIVAFVVVVIGGIGSIRGAFIGAILVGLADVFGKVLFPNVSSLGMYVLMAAVLIWRPEGLFGAPAR
jgi:branched-chain amino acid transport system permease protein